MTVVSYGESNPVVSGTTSQAHSQNRRVVAIANQHIISRALDLIPPTDYYLVDATGSMAGDKWQAVINHKYTRSPTGEDPEIYAFNSCMPLRPLKYKNEIGPDCETPLWDMTEELLSKMSVGQTLTILSDGKDNQSRNYTPASLTELAKTRGVKVSTIGIGVDEVTRQNLRDLATQTGGSFYLSK